MTWTGTTPLSNVSILRGGDWDSSGVFVDVNCDVSFADLGLCDAFLVASHGSDDTERP